MQKYYVKGYTTPAGVKNKEGAKRIQASLGVKQDGIWGAKTQAAWEKQYGALWQEPAPIAQLPATIVRGYTPKGH